MSNKGARTTNSVGQAALTTRPTRRNTPNESTNDKGTSITLETAWKMLQKAGYFQKTECTDRTIATTLNQIALSLSEIMIAKSTVKEIQAFLELANYYRRFIKNFSKIAEPLNYLTKKNQLWN